MSVEQFPNSWLKNASALACPQGLTLVHFPSQPEPFWSHLPVSPCLIDKLQIMHPTYQQNVLTLSRKVDECQPMPARPRPR